MEQIYSVVASNSPSNKRLIKWVFSRKCVSSLSRKNLLAFTSFSDLSKPDSKYFSNYVYVLDLNLPHEPILVTIHNNDVTTIEWDNSGFQLLIGDICGNVEIWSMKDHLINKWMVRFKLSAFPGEPVISATWFHNGVRTVILPEKIETLCSYEEKFTALDFKPSVVQFGGRPGDGCVAVSNSGLVWCVVLMPNNTYVCDSKVLGNSRTRIKLVDICKRKNGDLLVITSNGSTNSPINSYQLSIKIDLFISSCGKNQCTIECVSFASLNLESAKNSSVSTGYSCVDQLRFLTGEETDGNLSVIVGVSGENFSSLELWECREKPFSVHKAFQPKSGPESPQFKRVVWQYVATSQHDQPLAAICVQKFSLYKGRNSLCYILVAYKDNTLKCLTHEDLQPIYQVEVTSASSKINQSNTFNLALKQTPNFPVLSIVNIQYSWSGCIAVVMDSLSQLFVYRITSPPEAKSGSGATFFQTLLEYCLFTNQDWWDVLVSIRSNMVESVCESLVETFNQRQSQEVQKKYMNQYLTIKASLYRLYSEGNATTGQNKSGDCYTLIMLNAVSNTIKSQLRPSVNQEKELPAEFLSNIIQIKGTDQQYFNVDKVLLALDPKELTKDYAVEPNIVLSLQHLNQWIGDFCLFLLASLPQQFHNNYRFPGGGLISDPQSLNELRECLVIIRIWGLIKDTCLPACTKLTKDVDLVPLAFKLLSKAVASMGNESDESFLEECCSLPNQFLIPSLDLTLKARGVASPILFTNTLPLQFQYFTEAPFLEYHVKTHVVDGTVDCRSDRKMDTIRYICLGPKSKTNESVRRCTRCSAMSLYTNFKSPSTRIWDSRWCNKCICGGHWRLG